MTSDVCVAAWSCIKRPSILDQWIHEQLRTSARLLTEQLQAEAGDTAAKACTDSAEGLKPGSGTLSCNVDGCFGSSLRGEPAPLVHHVQQKKPSKASTCRKRSQCKPQAPTAEQKRTKRARHEGSSVSGAHLALQQPAGVEAGDGKASGGREQDASESEDIWDEFVREHSRSRSVTGSGIDEQQGPQQEHDDQQCHSPYQQHVPDQHQASLSTGNDDAAPACGTGADTQSDDSLEILSSDENEEAAADAVLVDQQRHTVHATSAL
eukprot:jgi/Chrzof1/11931/Cz06g15030.t1